MVSIEETYQQQAQKHLDYIRLVSEACQRKCDELKVAAEQAIAALGPDQKEREIKIKVELKKNLDRVIQEFEKEMRKSFGNNLTMLEAIYHQKELLVLKEIEENLEAVYH